MDKELRFVVSLKDNASRQAKTLARNLQQFNTNYTSTINLRMVDNVTTKLNTLSSLLSSRRFGALNLAVPNSAMTSATKFSNIVQGIFNTSSGKKWYETIYGFFAGLTKQALKLGTVLAGIFAAVGAVEFAAAGFAVAALAKKLIVVNSQMEQFQVSLQTTIGSLTAAKEEMAGIVQFAKETPYAIRQVTDAVVKLRAYSMAPEKWLRPLGDMASAFGREITDAVEAAADAVQGMFRRALSYGIKMERADFKKGGKYAGMDYAEAFLMEVERRFKGGMALQAKTLAGIWSNVKDVLTIAFQKATAPVYNIIKSFMADIYDTINNPAYVDKFVAKFSTVVDYTYKFFIALQKAFIYLKVNIGPMFAELGEAGLTTFKSVITILGALVATVLTPLLPVFSKMVEMVSWLVIYFKDWLKWIVALRTGIWIFKMLTSGIAATSVELVKAGKHTSYFASQLDLLVGRMVRVGVTFGAMWAVSKFIEVRNGLKDIGNTFDAVAGGADKVKDYLKNLGEQSGQTLAEMVKAASAAKEFGANAPNALKSGAEAAKELGISAQDAVAAVGNLAKNMIAVGDSSVIMAQKTRNAAAMLDYLKNTAKDSGIIFDNAVATMAQYPDVIKASADNMEDLTAAMIAYSQATEGADLGGLFAEISKMLAPSEKMLKELDPSAWISLSTADLRTMGEEMAANAEVIEDLLRSYGYLGSAVSQFTGEIDETSYTLRDVSKFIKELSIRQETAADSAEFWGERVQDLQEELDRLQGMITTLNIELEDLNDTMKQAMSVLDLASATIEMKEFTETVGKTGKSVAELTAGIKKQEAGLAPLKQALDVVETKFGDISDAIDEAEEKLYKFTHPQLEGMGEFDDQIHTVDMGLNKLKRMRLDALGKLKPFEDLGLTGTDAYRRAAAAVGLTSIDEQIAKLENKREKLELDRANAYDDQLYQLDKLNRAEEISYDTAWKGAQAELAKLDVLRPQAEAYEAQRDSLQKQLDIQQQQIDEQQALVDGKKAELDAQLILIENEKERLELYKQIYDAEAAITDTKLVQAKIDAAQGKVTPAAMILIEQSYKTAAQSAAKKEVSKGALERQVGKTTAQQTSYEALQTEATALSEQLLGDIKTAVTQSANLVAGINFDALINSPQAALENVFGADNMNVFVDMREYLKTIAEMGPPDSENLGFMGKMANFFTSGPGLATIGALIGGKMLSKGVLRGLGKSGTLTEALTKKLGRTIGKSERLQNLPWPLSRLGPKFAGVEGVAKDSRLRGKLGEFLATRESKAIVRTLPSNFAARIPAAQEKALASYRMAINEALKAGNLTEATRLEQAAGELQQRFKNLNVALKNNRMTKEMKSFADEIIEATGTSAKTMKNTAQTVGKTTKGMKAAPWRRLAAGGIMESVSGIGSWKKIAHAFTGPGSIFNRISDFLLGANQINRDVNAVNKGSIMKRWGFGRIMGKFGGGMMGKIRRLGDVSDWGDLSEMKNPFVNQAQFREQMRLFTAYDVEKNPFRKYKALPIQLQQQLTEKGLAPTKEFDKWMKLIKQQGEMEHLVARGWAMGTPATARRLPGNLPSEFLKQLGGSHGLGTEGGLYAAFHELGHASTPIRMARTGGADTFFGRLYGKFKEQMKSIPQGQGGASKLGVQAVEGTAWNRALKMLNSLGYDINDPRLKAAIADTYGTYMETVTGDVLQGRKMAEEEATKMIDKINKRTRGRAGRGMTLGSMAFDDKKWQHNWSGAVKELDIERARLGKLWKTNNPFAEYSDVMPKVIQQQLVELKAKNTDVFKAMMKNARKRGLTGFETGVYSPEYFKGKIQMPGYGKMGLGTEGGLWAYMHELGHAGQRMEPLEIPRKTPAREKLYNISRQYSQGRFGGNRLVEGNAWKRALMALQGSGVDMSKQDSFFKLMQPTFASYVGNETSSNYVKQFKFMLEKMTGKLPGARKMTLGAMAPGEFNVNTFMKQFSERGMLAGRYDKTTNPFAKYSSFMPVEVQQQLTEMGGKPTKQFDNWMKRALKEGQITSTTWEKPFSAFRTNLRGRREIAMAAAGPHALGSEPGMWSWFHELGHATQPQKVRGTSKMGSVWNKFLQERQIGRFALPGELSAARLPTTAMVEGTAWTRAGKMGQAAGIDVLNNPAFWGSQQKSLASYIGKEGALDEGAKTMRALAKMPKAATVSKFATDLEKTATTAVRQGGLSKTLGVFSRFGATKAGKFAGFAGNLGMMAGLGDTTLIGKALPKVLGKIGLGKIAGGGITKMFSKALIGGGLPGLALMGVDIVNMLKGDFMNEKVWKKAFGGKTIQEFVKDNPISRAMYKAFGKGNVTKMLAPIGNLWSGLTHASDAVYNLGGMAGGIVKGIFTGKWGGVAENAKKFGSNVFGIVKDAGGFVKSYGGAVWAGLNTLFGKKLPDPKPPDMKQLIKEANIKVDEVNAQLKSVGIDITYDQEKLDRVVAAYAHTKEDLKDPIKLVIEAEMDKAKWDEFNRLAAVPGSIASTNVALVRQKTDEQLAMMKESLDQGVIGIGEYKAAVADAQEGVAREWLNTLEGKKEARDALIVKYQELGLSLGEAVKVHFATTGEELVNLLTYNLESKGFMYNPDKALWSPRQEEVKTQAQKAEEARLANRPDSVVFTGQRVRLPQGTVQVIDTMKVQKAEAIRWLKEIINTYYSGAEGFAPLNVNNIDLGPRVPPSKTRQLAMGMLNKAEIRTAGLVDEIQWVLNTYQQGGVTNWSKNVGKLAVLHGNEAVVPLKSGSIPVRLNGSGTVTINNTFGDMNFVVRTDEDIEEIKRYLLKLSQGQTTYFDNPNMYTERF